MSLRHGAAQLDAASAHPVPRNDYKTFVLLLQDISISEPGCSQNRGKRIFGHGLNGFSPYLTEGFRDFRILRVQNRAFGFDLEKAVTHRVGYLLSASTCAIIIVTSFTNLMLPFFGAAP
jgi:hypothetical protein